MTEKSTLDDNVAANAVGVVCRTKSEFAFKKPYTFSRCEKLATYTLPFAMLGGLNLPKLPTSSRLRFKVLLQSSFVRSPASKALRTPGTISSAASPVSGNDAQTIPLPGVVPFAETDRSEERRVGKA